MYYIDADTFILYKKKVIFIKILHRILKLDLILQVTDMIDHCLKEKAKSNWINERWITWKNHDKICSIKSKTYG